MDTQTDSQVTTTSVTTEVTNKPPTSAFIKFIRIFLLILIVIGIGLICTINLWVPSMVSIILNPQPTTVTPTATATPESTQPISVTPSSFVGIWGGGDPFNYVSLVVIKDPQDASHHFLFTLKASSGANTGEISSDTETPVEAILSGGNHATFDDKQGCVVSFTLTSSSTIEIVARGCDTYAGQGVSFDGTYEKNAKPQVPSIESFFDDPQLMNSPSAFVVFKKLVGKDISTFNDTTDLMTTVDTDPADQPAKTYSFTVQGLGGIAESIVMIAPGNKIWTAVISPDGKSVWYYTTEPADRKIPPQTIQDWNVSNLKVVDKS